MSIDTGEITNLLLTAIFVAILYVGYGVACAVRRIENNLKQTHDILVRAGLFNAYGDSCIPRIADTLDSAVAYLGNLDRSINWTEEELGAGARALPTFPRPGEGLPQRFWGLHHISSQLDNVVAQLAALLEK
jgi:hypothetical protein